LVEFPDGSTGSILRTKVDAWGLYQADYVTAGKTWTLAKTRDSEGHTISMTLTGVDGEVTVVFPTLEFPLAASDVQSADINVVAYGAGKYVCGGEAQWIHRSTDLASWSGQYIGGSIYFIEWVAQMSSFVACTSNGKILTSPDGVAWTTRATITGGYVWFVHYVDGILFAGCKSGYLYRADPADPTTWIQTDLYEASQVPTFVCKGSSVFLAASESGKVYTSADGSAWTHRFTIPDKVMYCFFFNNRFVICGNNGKAYYSDDGLSIDGSTQLGGGLMCGAIIPHEAGDRLVLATQPVSGTSLVGGLVYASDDGATFEQVASMGGSIARIMLGNNRLLFAIGNDVYTSQEII
jgi:hypothetical protein